jgi:alkylated DNA repair dioxygenase AlkB
MKRLLRETVQVKAQALIDRMYAAFDQARNALVWSYPAIYLTDELKRPMLTQRQSNLELWMEQVATLVFHYDYEEYMYSHINRVTEKLEKSTADLLAFAGGDAND